MLGELVKTEAPRVKINLDMKLFAKVFRKTVFMGFVLAIAGCSGDSTPNVLSITATKLSFILPKNLEFPDGDSCYPGDTVTSPRYSLPRLTTTWSGEGSFEPVLIILEISESGNISKNSCPFDGGNNPLALSLGFDAATITTGAATSIARDSLCIIHCGSLTIKNKAASFITTVKVKLTGIHTDASLVQRPVSATTTFSLQNIP